MSGCRKPDALQTVARGIGGLDQRNQIAELPLDDLHSVEHRSSLLANPIPSDPANRDHAAQEPASRQFFVQGDRHFPESPGVGVGDHEPDVGGNGADVGDVVVDALQLQQNGAHELGAERDLNSRRPLDRLAERRAVGEGGIAGNALGQEHGAVYWQVLEELLRAFVRIEHAQLQVEDGLSGDGEVEMAGLDDAGMDRTHRNLEDAFAQRRPVHVLLAFEGGQYRIERKVLPQGVYVRPVVVQCHAARIGVSGGFESKPVLDLALLPVDRR